MPKVLDIGISVLWWSRYFQYSCHNGGILVNEIEKASREAFFKGHYYHYPWLIPGLASALYLVSVGLGDAQQLSRQVVVSLSSSLSPDLIGGRG
jgi:hypothetical protein